MGMEGDGQFVAYQVGPEKFDLVLGVMGRKERRDQERMKRTLRTDILTVGGVSSKNG